MEPTQTINDSNAESSIAPAASATRRPHGNPFNVIRRNGKLTPFDRSKIAVAMTKAFLAVEGQSAAVSSRIHETVERLARQIEDSLFRRSPEGGTVHIEDIQDQVELALMRAGEHKVVRAYVLYRERHAAERAEQAALESQADLADFSLPVSSADGTTVTLQRSTLVSCVEQACAGLDTVSVERIVEESWRHLYEGMPQNDVISVLLMTTRQLLDQEPDYSFVAARLLLSDLAQEAWAFLGLCRPGELLEDWQGGYGEYFASYIRRGIELELLDGELGHFDLARLGAALNAGRDQQFTYLGLQTLYDRYFLHSQEGTRFELPQAFFMRVAMGLAINEIDREARAIEFYDLLSSFDFMSSTPTLFNSGTRRPQLSSCYLTTVPDALDGIYSAIRDNALLSKFAGGLGNDWTRVRGLGAHIKGTNGSSQGVVPFLKVANDTAVAVNQGGKRKGAVCAYLETWHIDIEEFLELRKNTGDERRRTHDMNTANWIPDLFIKRVAEDGDWTLFSPEETPELHDSFGEDFEHRYLACEEKAARGELRIHKTLKAVDLWRRILGMVFETGHPWITFKDPCNLRSPQQHAGVVHSSNLCTEITLNTSDDEIAVCNLGSINLVQHLDDNGDLDMAQLQHTVSTAMRMLDNVIEYNYYSVPQARRSNLRHRPVGLGIMAFQDALYRKRIAYASEEAVEFADRTMEAVSWFTIKASTDLAEERGRYASFDGSLWSRGILPIDSIELLEQGRGGYLQQDRSATLDWDSLRQRVQSVGMRNSNTMAIAPTATIANICGVSQSIEPTYQNLFVKSNLSGEFTVVNPYLVRDLKALGLWDEVMVNDLKYYDGSVQAIDRIPDELKRLYTCAFELDARWLIEAASRRQKWIDQAQSLNLYLAEPSGKTLDNLYKLAWVRGLKTTYYLRSMGATAMEKTSEPAPRACAIDDPGCEACQ